MLSQDFSGEAEKLSSEKKGGAKVDRHKKRRKRSQAQQASNKFREVSAGGSIFHIRVEKD